MATWFNRLSKLPGCSDVVIFAWNGHNISEQVTLDCSIDCAVNNYNNITYGLETQHNMYPLKQFPDLNL
jgi:hypothetical protein